MVAGTARLLYVAAEVLFDTRAEAESSLAWQKI